MENKIILAAKEYLMEAKQHSMKVISYTKDLNFTGYSSKLPLPADVATYCQHLDIHGNRCTSVAKSIYTHHGDPELGDGWYAVYVCDKHLADVMHVDVIK